MEWRTLGDLAAVAAILSRERAVGSHREVKWHDILFLVEISSPDPPRLSHVETIRKILIFRIFILRQTKIVRAELMLDIVEIAERMIAIERFDLRAVTIGVGVIYFLHISPFGVHVQF